MRGVLAALLILMAFPALADEWTHYENARFGYAIDVPPGFVPQDKTVTNDGLVFLTPTAQLHVYGGHLARSFEDDVQFRIETTTANGFAIRYQATTPSWATYSAASGSRILYERMIALCGDAIAAFVLVYYESDAVEFEPTVDRLVRSLRPSQGGVCSSN